METSEEEGQPPEFPPQTYRWMSWSAIKFINRPPLRPLAWICYGLLAVLVGAFAATFFINVDMRIESDGDLVDYPGLLAVLVRADGLMGERKVAPGATVAKGEILSILQADAEQTLSGPSLERTRVRSPSAGRLIQYEVEPNASVRAGQAVATILPRGSALVARMPVEAEDLPYLAVGQHVRYRLEAFPSQRYGLFVGEVLALDGSKKENGEYSYKVKASVRPPPRLPARLADDVRLVTGMKLHAQIITGHHTVIEIIDDTLFGQR